MENKLFFNKIINRIYDADVNYKNVSNVCYEAKEYGFIGVEVFPNMIELAKKTINGANINICATITYPHGTFTAEQKSFEIQDAISAGADEVEVCINNLNVRSENWELVEKEMRVIRESSKDKSVSIIIETEYLIDAHIVRCCEIAKKHKIDCIITSTGLYSTLDDNKNDVPIQTTVEEVKLIKGVVGNTVKIRAQGNIDSYQMAKELIDAGADMIGTRFAVKISDELQLQYK